MASGKTGSRVLNEVFKNWPLSSSGSTFLWLIPFLGQFSLKETPSGYRLISFL